MDSHGGKTWVMLVLSSTPWAQGKGQGAWEDIIEGIRQQRKVRWYEHVLEMIETMTVLIMTSHDMPWGREPKQRRVEAMILISVYLITCGNIFARERKECIGPSSVNCIYGWIYTMQLHDYPLSHQYGVALQSHIKQATVQPNSWGTQQPDHKKKRRIDLLYPCLIPIPPPSLQAAGSIDPSMAGCKHSGWPNKPKQRRERTQSSHAPQGSSGVKHALFTLRINTHQWEGQSRPVRARVCSRYSWRYEGTPWAHVLLCKDLGVMQQGSTSCICKLSGRLPRSMNTMLNPGV